MESDLFTRSWWQTMETNPIPSQPTDFLYDADAQLDQRLQFRSALSSMTSSPAASDSNNISGDALKIGESVQVEESPTNTSYYSTPLDSAAMNRSCASKCSRKRKSVPKDKSKVLDPCQDYIHVRARRGEATDSHSLAERVRREKIGERMQFLQDLVPGCDKVTGKAVMLDEIINYVQSLQLQVEFLSMKVSTVDNPTQSHTLYSQTNGRL